MGDKYLSEVIDFERDIAPYRLVTINAGVGSGKSSWVESVATNSKSVLSLTSRKVVADVQAHKTGAVRYIELEGFTHKNKVKVLKGDIIFTTNAGLESFMKNKIESAEDIDYMLDSLDLIVVDEVHSLSADSMFADSPFYVHKFLEYAICNEHFNGTIVLMSGTIKAAQWLITDLKGRIKERKYNKLDMFEECKHIEPKNVYFFQQDAAVDKAIELLKEDNRIIYFVNRITRMASIVEKLIDSGIDYNSIGISYSSSSKNDDKIRRFPQAAQSTLKDSLEEIDEHLHGDGIIPDKYKIVLSTAVNKEGISIMNTDIDDVFAESMVKADLIQKAGRLRAGFNNFYVVFSYPKSVKTEDYDYILANNCIDGVNNAYKDFIKEYTSKKAQLGEKTKKEIVEHYEEKFPYIKYSIISDSFEFYNGRENGVREELIDSNELHNCIEKWNSEGKAGIEKWFPYSKVFEPVVSKTTKDKIHDEIKGYLSHCLGVIINYSEREEILNHLNEILNNYGEKSNYTAINSVLKLYGYNCSSVGKNVKAKDGKYVIKYCM